MYDNFFKVPLYWDNKSLSKPEQLFSGCRCSCLQCLFFVNCLLQIRLLVHVSIDWLCLFMFFQIVKFKHTYGTDARNRSTFVILYTDRVNISVRTCMIVQIMICIYSFEKKRQIKCYEVMVTVSISFRTNFFFLKKM